MKKIAIIILSALTLTMLSSTAITYADDTSETLKETTFDVGDILSPEDDERGEPTGQEYLKEDNPIVAFILTVINFAIQIMGSIAIIIIIIGGFMFMFAQGNQQKLDEAKDILKYAVIGLLVALLSYIIVIFVQSLFTTTLTPETPAESTESTT
jgi:hypothetical protein